MSEQVGEIVVPRLNAAVVSNYGYVMDDGALSDKIMGREIKGGSF